MAIKESTLTFTADNQNMWGSGNAGVDQTWEMWALNQHLSFNPKIGFVSDLVSAHVGINASADTKLGLIATLQGTTGDVDLNYQYVSDVYSPDVALAGSQVEINTANWYANYESINSNSPNFQFDLGLAYQFDLNASLDYDSWSVLTGKDSGTIASLSFGTGGVKTLPIVHLGMNPGTTETSSDYFSVNLLNGLYEASLPGDTKFNFDNLFPGLIGYLALPGSVHTNATNTSPTQNDTLFSYGTSSPFFKFGVDIDQLVGYFYGIDTSKLEGDISLPLSLGDLHYELLDMDVYEETSLAQKFTFNPDNIILKMTSSLGETKQGVLGDSFIFNTPASGEGNLTFDTKYYLSGTLTNNTGINGAVYVDLDVLNFGQWAFLDQKIPLVNGDMWLINKELPVDMGVQKGDFQVHYSDDQSHSTGPNNLVLGSDNKITFNLTKNSDIDLELTGLDSITELAVTYSPPAGIPKFTFTNNLTQIFQSGNFVPAYEDTINFSRKDLPAGKYTFSVTPYNNTSSWVLVGTPTGPGFNVDYTIARTNHSPVFNGATSSIFRENHNSVYNYGNAIYDQDIANGDSLIYTITDINGNPLPAWLQIDTVTRTILATPPTGAGDVTLHIVAIDETGASTSTNLAITTPNPIDNAGNTIATARASGELRMDNAKTIYSDYVGTDDDVYDYYSFSTATTGDLGLTLANIKSLDALYNLDVELLNTSGTILGTSTWDDNLKQEILAVPNLVAGNYIARVKANTGHADYELSTRSAAIDGAGNFSLVPGQHIYSFTDYLSSADTLDSYSTNLDANAWVLVQGLDNGWGRNGWWGSFHGNGVSIAGIDVLDNDSFFGQSYWSGYLSPGLIGIDLKPDQWLVSHQVWVGNIFNGHWETVWSPTTFSGFTSAYMYIDRLPTVAIPVQDQTINISESFNFDVSNAFQDKDGDVIQSITATLTDGSPLPSWLVFDSSTRTFSGLLEHISEPVSVKLTAIFNGLSPDINSRTVTDTFTITPNVIDTVGNNRTSAQTINVSNELTFNDIKSTDGNDYFSLQLNHTTPLAIKISGVPSTAQAVLLASDGTELQTGMAGDKGELQFITKVLATGEYFLHLQTEANPAGYKLTINGGYQVPPSSQPKLESNSDNGLIINDGITSITTPLLTGSADPNTIVLLFDGKKKIGQTNADASGNWQLTTPILADGLHVLTAKVQDIAGNLSDTSAALNVTIDTQAPAAATQLNLSKAVIAAASATPVTVLTGVAEAGTVLSVYDGKELIGTALVDNSGLWQFAMPDLTDGTHAINVSATDLAGNESALATMDVTSVNFDIAQITPKDHEILMGSSYYNYVSFENATQPVTVNLGLIGEQNTGDGNKLLIGIEGIIGSTFDDVLQGNDEKNVIKGGLGADVMAGGKNDDVYIVNDATDQIKENAAEGIDSVISAISYSLKANIENLALSGTISINATGNNADNELIGNSGVNVLNGGKGADTLTGGLGDDSYVVDNVGDAITENLNEGKDKVSSSITYTLSTNVENLTLTGASAINGTGNSLANTLTGNTANNSLNGAAGADSLIGGLGDDSYTVDNVGDVIIENLDEGTDKISSSVTYMLAANVENLTLKGLLAINGTGNNLANVITGNTASNVLTGGAGNDTLNGAAGADTLIGGQGNDSYIIDNVGDVITEDINEGRDTVNSSVTYTLSANVESLVLTGILAINGTGNGLANDITGNSEANNLNGGGGDDTLSGGDGNDILNGGAGADILVGGLGNDSYTVDNAGDVVTENLSEGTDKVNSSVTYTLSANVENLTLTGTSAINGTGNNLDNALIGNTAVNVLNGDTGNDTLDGGLGNNVLTGGTGNDSFRFTTTGHVDTITDYNVVNDTIRMENAVFTALTATGTLAVNNFKIGAAAADADDFIIYNNVTGALLYDADGSGAGVAVQIASLTGGLAMTNADIVVI